VPVCEKPLSGAGPLNHSASICEAIRGRPQLFGGRGRFDALSDHGHTKTMRQGAAAPAALCRAEMKQ